MPRTPIAIDPADELFWIRMSVLEVRAQTEFARMAYANIAKKPGTGDVVGNVLINTLFPITLRDYLKAAQVSRTNMHYSGSAARPERVNNQ